MGILEGSIHLRPGDAEEIPSLREMLGYAAYWREGTLPADLDAALGRPDLKILLADWGRPGDRGVVAESSSHVVGAAWYRLWTDAVHSYGYVDLATPEIAIGVRPESRGLDVGTALMIALVENAKADGFKQLSLSVEVDNPAVRLYEGLHFERLEKVDGAWTMVLDLAD